MVLSFCSPNEEGYVLKEDVDYWMPVDQYKEVEHTILLLYSRFFESIR